VAALRLPERLTQKSTPYYSVGELSSTGARVVGAGVGAGAGAAVGAGAHHVRLHGVLCASAGQAATAAAGGADFLVLSVALAQTELAALCASIPMPVYARGIALETAWVLGASGVNEIA